MDLGLDRSAVLRAFERAAPTYDEATALHQEVGRRLREHLDPVRLEPRRVLDLGSGTGVCARDLEQRYRGAGVVAADLSQAMLARARASRRWWSRRPLLVRADAGALGFADASFDLVYSNLALHWCADLARALGEVARVSAPGALLAASTLGPDTFKELREAWAAVDDGPHVHALPDMHDVGDAIARAGFAGIVMEAEKIRVTYPDVDAMHRELRAQGAVNASRERARGLAGRKRRETFRAALADRFAAGRVELTYEVVYAHAWRASPREASVPVEDLIRRRRG